MKPIIILFLLGHILGDFYFQTDRLARAKHTNQTALLTHCLLYMAAMLLVTIPFFSWKLFLAALILGVLHCVVDESKYFYEKKYKAGKALFITDQVIHLVCIFAISFVLASSNVLLGPISPLDYAETVSGVSALSCITWLTVLLLNYKPASITISRLIEGLKPKDDQEPSSNAGRYIGLVERLIMLVFLVLDQFAAIGLVLTAKSIARFDRISKDQEFAEYYLLGTLLSTLFVIVTTILIL